MWRLWCGCGNLESVVMWIMVCRLAEGGYQLAHTQSTGLTISIRWFPGLCCLSVCDLHEFGFGDLEVSILFRSFSETVYHVLGFHVTLLMVKPI